MTHSALSYQLSRKSSKILVNAALIASSPISYQYSWNKNATKRIKKETISLPIRITGTSINSSCSFALSRFRISPFLDSARLYHSYGCIQNPVQRSFFVKIFNGLKPLTIYFKMRKLNKTLKQNLFYCFRVINWRLIHKFVSYFVTQAVVFFA